MWHRRKTIHCGVAVVGQWCSCSSARAMTTGLLDASVPCAMGCEGSYGIYFGKEEMLYYLNNLSGGCRKIRPI